MKKSFNHSVVFTMALLMTSGAFLGCEGGEASEECSLGEVGNECNEENMARCLNGNTEICQRDANSCLKWVVEPTNIFNCTKDEPAICSLGNVRCDGNNIMECKTDSTTGQLSWSLKETCPISCSGGECQTTCTNACSEGNKQCIGNIVQTCELGTSGCYEWKDGETCPVSCDDGKCPSTCTNVCVPGGKHCIGAKVQTCELGASGCYEWKDGEICSNSCHNGECQACGISCNVGTYSCNGKKLTKCIQDGECTKWEIQKTCSAYCKAEYATCTEDLPTCLLKPGSRATVLQWTDGDTLWVRAVSDGTCNDYEYTADSSGKFEWRNVRYRIRVEGIDAPECKKSQNSYHYYTCVQNTSYNNDNEPMGYESWVEAEKMVAYKAEVTISCEATRDDGSCDYDTTYWEGSGEEPRHVAYIGFTKDNASYDYSTEIARKGLAFANTEFEKTTTKIGDICRAQKEAINAKSGVWSLASTVKGVLGKMGPAKQKNLKNMETICNKY